MFFFPKEFCEPGPSHHGRALTDAEQYGAVKMRLFQAFDEIEDLMSDGRQFAVDSAGLEQALATLGVD